MKLPIELIDDDFDDLDDLAVLLVDGLVRPGRGGAVDLRADKAA